MRHLLILAAALVALDPSPARAHFWVWRGPVETRSAYYVCVAPVVSWAPVAPPLVYAPAPVFVPAVPVVGAVPLAAPRAAPPSLVPELPPLPGTPAPPVMPPASPPGTTTARRASTPFYDVYSGPAGNAPAGDRCSVAFWNLAGAALTLRVEGRDWVVPPGRSLTLELPRAFAWRVQGRAAETTSVAAARAEILIRR